MQSSPPPTDDSMALASSPVEERSAAVIVPGYQLLDMAGEGGMGTVFRAMQLSLNRVVAVKILHAASACGDSLPAFHRESRLLASLSHPHIVTIHDCGQHEGRYFLVTEFISGSPLRAAMTPGKPWPVGRAADTIDRIAQALIYIHQHSVLHLDLKPENVLCTSDGNIKIADFGLALARVDARVLSDLGLAQGTFDYCSPEQRFGLPTDERSDLFSLGVMTYELLTGQLPGRTYQSAVKLNRRLPAAVDHLLCRALARQPEERFQSVAEYNRQLQSVLRPNRPATKRNKSPIALGALLVLVLLLLYLGSHAQRIETRNEDLSTAAAPIDTTRPKCWLVYNKPESLQWFGELGAAQASPVWAADLQRIQPEGRYPEGHGAPPLPKWPGPLPAMVLQAPDSIIYVYPVQNARLAGWVGEHWKQLVDTKIRPEDNFVLNGDFSQEASFAADAEDWRLVNPLVDGYDIRIEIPPDRPNNPALHRIKLFRGKQAGPFGLYQWLRRIPEKPGEIVVLRFRARGKHGEEQVLVNPHVPIILRRDDHGPVAERLRALSPPHPYTNFKLAEGTEVREYGPLDWVRLGTNWQTYALVFDWPQYATEGWYRNIDIKFGGLGEVWVDDIEMFTWDGGTASQ